MKKIVLLLFFSVKIFSSFPRNEPWLTEKSITFLQEYLSTKPQAAILEFGSGASTLWFAKRTSNLHSVEHNPKYYDKVSDLLFKEGHDVDYQLLSRPYGIAADAFPDEYFDLVVVDGRDRVGCVLYAMSKVKPGGVLMLDNAERKKYRQVFKMLNHWKYFSTKQVRPDKFGFYYRGWRTDWWIKPLKN